jgi:elongation factor P
LGGDLFDLGLLIFFYLYRRKKNTMATTSDIRNGMCLEINGEIFTVVEFLHVKPGKGNAFVRTKIKSVTSGKVIDKTIQAGHKVDEVRVERRKFQFLYEDEMGFHFMDNETYDQITLDSAMVDTPKLMKEGTEVEILFHSEKDIPLTMEMPQYIVLEVTYSEPGLKGDTATNAMKPAKVETGAEIRVPLFINEGDKVKIDTRSGDYVERVKS